jgi:hypothetical protein
MTTVEIIHENADWYNTAVHFGLEVEDQIMLSMALDDEHFSALSLYIAPSYDHYLHAYGW